MGQWVTMGQWVMMGQWVTMVTHDSSVFVDTRDKSYNKRGGYKKELVTQNLTVMEESLVVCSVCRGIMHETCSIKSGLAQVCESCVGEEDSHQIASIRSTISKLICKCPLSERSCDWEGTLGGLVEHMKECNELIVQCPYIKYGCKEECKRGKLEEHRKEAKGYHTEVVSIFMADKVDQKASKIQELEAVVKEFSYLKNYLKLNGIIWNGIIRNHKPLWVRYMMLLFMQEMRIIPAGMGRLQKVQNSLFIHSTIFIQL